MSERQKSPDGKWEWDGTNWVPTDPAAPAAGGPPQQPTAPQPQYQQPYPQAPVKKSHTLRNVLLILGGLAILFIGGCAVLLGTAANEVDKAVDKANEADAQPGGPDNPLEITEGKAFEVSGFEYAAGWKVVPDGLGGTTLEDLKFTNNRDDKDSAIVEIRFMKGNEILDTADCASDPVPVGQTATLDCIGTTKSVKGYDTITISDAF